jgi:hypothetical protein
VIDCCGLLEIFPAGSIADEGGSHQGCDELVAAASVPQEPAQLIAQATETMRNFGHERDGWICCQLWHADDGLGHELNGAVIVAIVVRIAVITVIAIST